jgi:hypothetical protein
MNEPTIPRRIVPVTDIGSRPGHQSPMR